MSFGADFGVALALSAALPISFPPSTPAVQSDAGGKPLTKALGKDDALYARALSRAGYNDLADDILKAIAASGGSDSSARVDALRLDLKADQAAREMDPVARVAELEGLLQEREEFLKAHEGSPEAAEIRHGQLDLYRSVGELITQVIQEGKTEDAGTLARRGIDILEQAVKELRARQDSLDEQLKASELAPEAKANLDLERMINLYGLARTRYFLAQLYEPGFARQSVADQALKVLLDLQLDYPDQLLCFEGYIYEGLCNKLIENFDSAIESFDAAIGLRDHYERARNGVFAMDPAAADIVSSAVLQKMLLLSERGDNAGAVAVANDFLQTTAEPWTTLKGLAVLSELAEAYDALGDRDGLAATAKTLIEVDPNGPGAKRGRELLGEGGSGALGASELLRLAEQSARDDVPRAISLFQQAMILARGTANRDDISTRAGLYIGALYASEGQLHEAAVALHTTADRFPDGKDAPECLWRAIKYYQALQAQERRTVYKDITRELLGKLTSRYPEHQYAASASLIEGQQAEADQELARAVEIYEKIPPGSAGYEEGLYRAGDALSRMARQELEAGTSDKAKRAVERAEASLKKARAALQEAAGRTLEPSEQDRLRALSFSAQVALANLYLIDGVGRAGEVMPLFQNAEAEVGQNDDQMSIVWELRFRALNDQQKLDEAMALFDARVKENPSARWLGSGARLLAPILDTRATELRKADPKSAESDRLARKAATFYLMAIKGQLEGRESVRIETLESIADRLLVFALRFEGLPDSTESFVDWSGAPLSGELLEAAARSYGLLVPLSPSYRTAIKLARTLGFLGRWEEAASTYAELFERENFADPVTKTINQQLVMSKPELLFAYIEWGVAERQVGVARGDTSRLLRASGIFEALIKGTSQGSKLWWQSKYYQLQTLVDRGDYEVADVALKSVKLNWENFDDGQYGLTERFKKIEEELSKKVFQTKNR